MFQGCSPVVQPQGHLWECDSIILDTASTEQEVGAVQPVSSASAFLLLQRAKLLPGGAGSVLQGCLPAASQRQGI